MYMYFKFAIQNSQIAIQKKDFPMQIIFLHRTFAMQNFRMKSFPGKVELFPV